MLLLVPMMDNFYWAVPVAVTSRWSAKSANVKKTWSLITIFWLCNHNLGRFFRDPGVCNSQLKLNQIPNYFQFLRKLFFIKNAHHLTGEEQMTAKKWTRNTKNKLLNKLRYASPDRPMPGNAIWSSGSSERDGRSGDLRLGSAVTNDFPDPLITAYRPSVMHVSLISVLDGTALNWCKQGHLRAQMSETVLFGSWIDSASAASWNAKWVENDRVQ